MKVCVGKDVAVDEVNFAGVCMQLIGYPCAHLDRL